jgi:hypothetical protein
MKDINILEIAEYLRTNHITINDETIVYRNSDGKKHKKNGPAEIYTNGTKKWFLNGKLHREDGPACEWDCGEKQWYMNDNRHRVDGPAVIYPDGRKKWWLNGELVYDDYVNSIAEHTNLSEEFKKSIIKYELEK